LLAPPYDLKPLEEQVPWQDRSRAKRSHGSNPENSVRQNDEMPHGHVERGGIRILRLNVNWPAIMKKTLFATLLLVMSSLAVSAHDFNAGPIYIDHPMIKEAPPNAPVLGGYIMLQNNGTEDDRLVGIDSDAVEKVELHRTLMTNDIASMVPMTEGLLLPAGEIVWLGDGGTHAMFIKPSALYRDGDEVPATLVFEKAGRIDVMFKVEKRTGADTAPGHQGMDMGTEQTNGQ
jgi:copper(I)-binding protein